MIQLKLSIALPDIEDKTLRYAEAELAQKLKNSDDFIGLKEIKRAIHFSREQSVYQKFGQRDNPKYRMFLYLYCEPDGIRGEAIIAGDAIYKNIQEAQWWNGRMQQLSPFISSLSSARCHGKKRRQTLLRKIWSADMRIGKTETGDAIFAGISTHASAFRIGMFTRKMKGRKFIEFGEVFPLSNQKIFQIRIGRFAAAFRRDR
jgi:hypothetical protein